jgi:integrase
MGRKRHHHLRKIGDIWYFEKMVKGRRIKKGLSTSLADAIRIRDQYLKEILVNGQIQRNDVPGDGGPLFGEFAQTWSGIKDKEIKKSTMRDYRSAMNLYVLPRLGNTPIREINYLDIEEFKAGLNRSAKRINNILVPMRSIFKMAFKSGIVDDNIMLKVENLRTDPPMINPLTPDEVKKVLESAHPHYKEFFTTAFFTGMRFGEMAALKKINVKLERGIARICETLVYGVEGRPKTKKSNREIDLLPPVIDALRRQMEKTDGKSEYVFLDLSGKPLTPDHVRKVIWEPCLKKAGIKYRPLMQTRHTFATMMIDAGEEIGWVQKMLGHSSLQMIYTKYYSWIKKDTRNDGAAFMRNSYGRVFDSGRESKGAEAGRPADFTPNLHQEEKGPTLIERKSLNSLVAGRGFEPLTFGL